MIDISIVVDTRSTTIETKEDDEEYKSILSFLPAGVELNYALVEYLKQKYQILVSRLATDRAITLLSSKKSGSWRDSLEILGRTIDDGAAKKVIITSEEVHSAIADVLQHLVSVASTNLNLIITKLESDNVWSGRIFLRGEFRYLDSLAELLEESTRVKIVLKE